MIRNMSMSTSRSKIKIKCGIVPFTHLEVL
jgi:hypothetical protein